MKTINLILGTLLLMTLPLSSSTSAQSPSPAANDPIITRRFIDPAPTYPFSHTATIVETAPGHFLAAWIGGPGNRAPENNVWMAEADDSGWQPAKAVTDTPVADFNPVLVKDEARGEILFFSKFGASPENWTSVLRRSTDGGKTWSAPQILPAGMTGTVRNKQIIAPDGTWIFGDSVETPASWACWVNRTPDGGRTWRRFGPVYLPDTPRGIIQPIMFYGDAAKTKLTMLSRTPENIGHLCVAHSLDHGMTWTIPQPNQNLPNPNTAVDAVRMKDGRIALVHNDDTTNKSRLVLSLSTDGGETWKKAATIQDEKAGEYLYPTMVEDSQARLQIVYSWQKQKIEHVIIDPAKLN